MGKGSGAHCHRFGQLTSPEPSRDTSVSCDSPSCGQGEPHLSLARAAEGPIGMACSLPASGSVEVRGSSGVLLCRAAHTAAHSLPQTQVLQRHKQQENITKREQLSSCSPLPHSPAFSGCQLSLFPAQLLTQAAYCMRQAAPTFAT